MNFPNPYKWKHYRFLFVIPVLLMVAALFLIPGVPKGIDLKGGLLISVQSQQPIDQAALHKAIATIAGVEPEIRPFESPAGRGVEIELPLKGSLDEATSILAQAHAALTQWETASVDFSQGKGTQGLVDQYAKNSLDLAQSAASKAGATLSAKDPAEAVRQADDAVSKARSDYRDQLLASVQKVAPATSVSVREVGSSLSAFFFAKTQQVVLMSFLLCAIIVFLIFREVGPSFAVIFGAVADVVITAGAMSLFQIPWSLASVAALLMLVGFSLDTDMMMTIRVLKRKEGDAKDRAFESMRTGLLMNLTTLSAFGVLAALSLVLQIPSYYQIGAVATIGGLVDFIATWCGNAPLLLWLHERKEAKAL